MQECLELSGILEKIENKVLDRTVLGIFKKLEVMMDPSNAENCHWTKCSKGSKKVIKKLSRHNGTSKVLSSKKV